jgi:hypothetical protein
VAGGRGGGGVWGDLVGLYKDGGVRALFRGNGVNCLKVAPEVTFRTPQFAQYQKWGPPVGTWGNLGRDVIDFCLVVPSSWPLAEAGVVSEG